MSRTHISNISQVTPALLQEVARALEKGALAVLPTDTVYGLGTGAFCEEAIAKIYALKQRPATSPLQLLTGSLAQAQQAAYFSPKALRLAQTFWPGALTLIVPPAAQGKTWTRGFKGLGFRVPRHSFLVNLLEALSMPLACTSANLHGQAVLTNEQAILETFDGKVDFIFTAGTLSPVASSVVDMIQTPRLLREGAISKEALEQVLGEPFLVEGRE